jgi:hypothetical protein
VPGHLLAELVRLGGGKVFVRHPAIVARPARGGNRRCGGWDRRQTNQSSSASREMVSVPNPTCAVASVRIVGSCLATPKRKDSMPQRTADKPSPQLVRELQVLVQKELEGCTSEELGERTGIHPVNVRHFATSGTRLGVAKLELLAEFFGLHRDKNKRKG